MSCETFFLNQLRKQGFRLTPQREMILSALHQIGHPAPVEELYALVAEKSVSLELSTIYRTLDLLSSMNLVAVIDIGDKQRLYELVGTRVPHNHLVCRECRKIIEVEVDLFQPLLDHLEDQAHFHADVGNLTVLGLCEECKQAELLENPSA